MIWEWSCTFDADPLASTCTFIFYAAAVDSKMKLRFGSSTPSVLGEFTLSMQQLHLHIHYKAAATFNRHLQFGSSKISSSRKSIMIFFYLYISPYIITHFLHLINRFFCLTEKISGIFLLIKAFGRGCSLMRICSSNFTAYLYF